jgi:uncharacterized protein involved in outer membrane biogenesis
VRRWFIFGLLGLFLVLLTAVAGGILWVTQADLRPYVEDYASQSLGRKVTATDFEIGWGDPLTLTIRDLRIANAPWGSKPEMITLGSLDAAIDPRSIWDGQPIYRQLRVKELEVVLERDEAGNGNWKFDAGDGGGSGGGGIIPKNRTQFPTLIDMALEDGLITYRTYSGNILRITLQNIAIASPEENSPVTLSAEGAYNDTPLTLAATTESFQKMRDASHPFATEVTLAGRTVRLDFNGTMMEPLDVDGLNGKLKLDAPELDNLLATFGSDMKAAYPLLLTGQLTRQGDHWELNDAQASIADMPFSGKLVLDEGSRGAPDSMAADLSFDALSLDALIGEGGGAETDWRQQMVPSPENAGVNLDLALAALQLSYGTTTLTDFSGKARLDEKQAALDDIAFGIAGGKVMGDLQVTADGKTPSLAMVVTAKALNADLLSQTLGAPAGDITGKLDGLADLSGQGHLLGDVFSSANGHVLIAMTGGSLRESLLEMASTDLRALFREEKGTAPIHCFGLQVTLAGGAALLQPLQLQAEGAVLEGAGRIDLASGAIDLRVQSQRAASGFFALDLPVHIGGTLNKVSAGLAEKDQKPLDLPVVDDAALSPAMRELRAGNACLG